MSAPGSAPVCSESLFLGAPTYPIMFADVGPRFLAAVVVGLECGLELC